MYHTSELCEAACKWLKNAPGKQAFIVTGVMQIKHIPGAAPTPWMRWTSSSALAMGVGCCAEYLAGRSPFDQPRALCSLLVFIMEGIVTSNPHLPVPGR